eukprot:49533_1
MSGYPGSGTQQQTQMVVVGQQQPVATQPQQVVVAQGHPQQVVVAQGQPQQVVYQQPQQVIAGQPQQVVMVQGQPQQVVIASPSVAGSSVVGAPPYAGSQAPSQVGRARTATIGEMNLAQRSCQEKFNNFIGICMATFAMGNEIYILVSDYQAAEAKNVLFMFVSLISLIINIVDYRTGDCECLRTCIMVTVCLWWTKLCCEQCYIKTSLKFLALINGIIWALLFINDYLEWVEGGSNLDSISDLSFFAGLVENMKGIKLLTSVIGVGAAVLGVLLKWFAKCMAAVLKLLCYALCCLFFIILILMAIAQAEDLSATEAPTSSGYAGTYTPAPGYTGSI